MRAGRVALFVMVAVSTAAVALAARRKAKPPPPPPPPPPQVSLALDAPTPHQWTMKVANTGTVPLRIVADSYLLSLDVTPPGGRTVSCRLPRDMQPVSDVARALVLVPGRSYTAHFDPRLYCFSSRDAAALVPGASVVGHFGWRSTHLAPPYVTAALVAGDAGAPAAAKEIQAPPITLPPAPADAGAPEAASTTVPTVAFREQLKVTMPARLDIGRLFERQTVIRVTNEGERSLRVLVRPQTLGFVVRRTDGRLVRCSGSLAAVAIPELLHTLSPRRHTSEVVGIGPSCPDGTFLHSGLYVLRPVFDARQVTAPDDVTNVYTGVSEGEPSLMRLHSGAEPRPAPRVDPP